MDFTKVREYLENCVREGVPMAQVCATRGYETLCTYTVGWQDAEKTIPATDDTLCWCYSNTKVYVAVCLMRLVEEGKIGLDDPVCKYLPEYEVISYKDGDEVRQTTKPVTVRQLITMTSGLTYNKKGYLHFSEALEKPGVTTREVAAALAKEVWKFEPGTDHIYGLGHDVVPAVIEVVTGMRFEDYMRQLIFEPLGIRDTGFHPDAAQRARFAQMYTWKDETKEIVLRENRNEYSVSENYESGGAGMFSSPKEYIKLLTVLACGGVTKDGYRLLKPETIRQMATNELNEKQMYNFRTKRTGQELPGKKGYGYGLGVRVHMDPAASGRKTSIGEFGWTGAMGALSLVDPERRLAIVYAEHIRGHEGKVQIHTDITNLIIDELEK